MLTLALAFVPQLRNHNSHALAKVFTVIVEPKEGERGLTQRKVGMYSCDKCGTKFPTVVSRQHYLVVPDDQMARIQTDIKSLKKTNQDLEKRIQLMDRSTPTSRGASRGARRTQTPGSWKQSSTLWRSTSPI